MISDEKKPDTRYVIQENHHLDASYPSIFTLMMHMPSELHLDAHHQPTPAMMTPLTKLTPELLSMSRPIPSRFRPGSEGDRVEWSVMTRLSFVEYRVCCTVAPRMLSS